MRIFAMWMACYTQQEIAETENMPQPTVAALVKDFIEIGNLAKSDKAAAEHATDFEVPIYSVWKKQTRRPRRPPGSNSPHPTPCRHWSRYD